MKQNRKYFPAIILIWIIILFFSGCSNQEQTEIQVPGVVDGDIVTVKSLVSGTITELDTAEGDRVDKDKLMAKVDSEKVENQVNELEINSRSIDIDTEKLSKKLQLVNSEVLYYKKQVERFRRLTAKNAIPGENLEAMELKLQQSETSRYDINRSLDGLKVQQENIRNKQAYLQLVLKDHSILSPVNGVILEKFISDGEQVVPGTAIVDILDLASLHIEIFIEENEMGRLKLNQEAQIKVDGLKGKELTGTISYFGKKAEFSPKYIISEKERKALLYEVKIKVQDPDGLLKIGMPVTVIIK